MTASHVLLLSHSLRGGGAERATLTLARTLARRGVHVTILLRENAIDYPIDFPVRVEQLEPGTDSVLARVRPVRNRRERRALRRRYASLCEEHGRVNLVISSLPPPDRLGTRSRLPNTYCVIHNTLSRVLATKRPFVRRRYLRRFRRTYRGQNLISVSEGVAEDLYAPLRIAAQSVRTIYNPIDLDWIREQALLAAPPIQEDYVIHVGRFDPQKRHDILLSAFAQAHRPRRLVLLGSGTVERQRELERMCERLGIQDRVSFAGFHANPYPWIRNARLLLLSSDYEGMGIVIAEALACGTPVVSTDCDSGPRELLTGNLSRGLVPIGDAPAFARAMDELWQAPPAIPESVLDRFSADKVADRYMALCR